MNPDIEVINNTVETVVIFKVVGTSIEKTTIDQLVDHAERLTNTFALLEKGK